MIMYIESPYKNTPYQTTVPLSIDMYQARAVLAAYIPNAELVSYEVIFNRLHIRYFLPETPQSFMNVNTELYDPR